MAGLPGGQSREEEEVLRNPFPPWKTLKGKTENRLGRRASSSKANGQSHLLCHSVHSDTSHCTFLGVLALEESMENAKDNMWLTFKC